MDEEVAKMHEQVATRTGSYHKLRHGEGANFYDHIGHGVPTGGATMGQPRLGRGLESRRDSYARPTGARKPKTHGVGHVLLAPGVFMTHSPP